MRELDIPDGLQTDRDTEKPRRYDNVCLMFTYGPNSPGMELLDFEELLMINGNMEGNSYPLLTFCVEPISKPN